MPFASDVPAWLARVGSLSDETRPGGHRKPRAACRPVEGRAIDDAAATRRRAEGDRRMAERTRPDEADRQDVLCQRAAASRCTDRPSTWPCENTAPPLPCPFSPIHTCCATLAASPWPTRARIRGSFRIISDTGTFSTPSSTPPPTRHGLKSSGGEIPYRALSSCMTAGGWSVCAALAR